MDRYLTKQKLRNWGACRSEYKKFCKYLGHNKHFDMGNMLLSMNDPMTKLIMKNWSWLGSRLLSLTEQHILRIRLVSEPLLTVESFIRHIRKMFMDYGSFR